jgi:hypothetical protein
MVENPSSCDGPATRFALGRVFQPTRLTHVLWRKAVPTLKATKHWRPVPGAIQRKSTPPFMLTHLSIVGLTTSTPWTEDHRG